MLRRVSVAVLIGAACLVPLAYSLGEAPVPAADHLDPPARTNPSNDSTPDFPADIADIYVFHDAAKVTVIVTFGGPAATGLAARYDPNVLFTVDISNRPPQTTSDHKITFQFAQETGTANGPWGVRVRGVPGVNGDIIGSVERTLVKDGVRVFTGLTDDPFFFDSQGLRESREMGTLRFRNDRDFFGAQNITSFVIEIPRERLENGTNTLDFWTSADRLGGQI
ncbi:DUF4331 domain-containing protein [Parerythrobacter lacustris]|uniref:DUF4331 domain-containing protein n=1 Tax=Parerythrobacter lacustris TaxID=2969984 RepID=A0ABT1XTR0_9SPHN|nr:DUF4331 domain-containing protein [Parerythrobacter lacustris]MCR2835028.1 DUF4331 domain-containing protein [Parerythrobacter lacustris]